jgi:prepilin peptidase CpaA
MTTFFLISFVLPVLLVFACFSDLFEMRISNRLCLLVAAMFPIFAIIAGLPLASVGMHVLAGFAVLVVTFALFACGWIGGGDAKFAAAVSVWMGVGAMVEYLAVASALGGILTLWLLMARKYPLPLFLRRFAWVEKLHHPKTGVPYGIALGAAALMVLPRTEVWALII